MISFDYAPATSGGEDMDVEGGLIPLWSDHGSMLGEHYMWRKGPL
jgi:hypothetical protein